MAISLSAVAVSPSHAATLCRKIAQVAWVNRCNANTHLVNTARSHWQNVGGKKNQYTDQAAMNFCLVDARKLLMNFYSLTCSELGGVFFGFVGLILMSSPLVATIP